MIENLEDEKVETILDSQKRDPVISRVIARLRESDHPYEINESEEGFDFTCTNLIQGVRNRANIKLFYPKEQLLLVFYYKRSNVSFSRDRFAYGGTEYNLSSVEVTDRDIESWLSFAEVGFSPEKRPEKLLRLFPYDIPT